MAQYLPGYQKLVDQSTPMLQYGAYSSAAQKAKPITDALDVQYNASIDPTRRAELGSWASRGFGLSGMADKGIVGALANLKSNFDTKKRDALYGIQKDELARVAQEQSLALQKEQAKPDKFLGIF